MVGSGIGKGIAKKFSENCAKVVILDFSEENGLTAEKEIENSYFIKTDVSDEVSVKKYGRKDY